MGKIFFILVMLSIFKYLFSLFFILRNQKVISYVIEIVIAGIVLYLLYRQTADIYFSLVVTQIYYIIGKIIILVIVVRLEIFSFRLLVAINRKTSFSKIICKIFDKKLLIYKLQKWQKVEYGPRLKLGLVKEAKTKHMKTGIRFDRNGFPIFKSYYTYRLPIREWRRTREVHFSRANKFLYHKAIKSKKVRAIFSSSDIQELKKGKTPEKYTWHHHQSRGKLQLVSREVHAAVEHIGGYSIWGPRI